MLFGKYVNKYYLKYFYFFLLGLLALLAVDWFQLEIPRITGDIIDGVKEGTLFDENQKFMNMMIYLGIIAVIMLCGRFLWRYCIFGVAVRIESDMREEMFKHSLSLSHQYYKENKVGALMALFTNDLLTIKQAFGNGSVFLVDAVFLGAFALAKMIKVNWILALMSVIPMSLIVLASMIVGKIMKQKFKERQEAYENLSDFAQENFSGISVVKAFVKEVIEIHHFKNINQTNYDKNINYARFSTLLDVILTLFISLIIAILIGGGAYFVVQEQVFFGEVFTTGRLFEFVAYFNTLVWPFMAISMLIQMRAQANASYQRIAEFMDQKVDIVDNEVEDINDIKGKIEFRHLNFKYPDANIDILHDITFTINAGEMVGIIGRTGCGKTTVVDLLLRTYNLHDGELYIDDKDIMHIPFKKVREAIGYVPQDNFLFSDTIANNIAFSHLENKENDEVEIIEAAKMADVHENIIDFELKYDTVLGERGVTLSGGQKQRVSIARALIKNPSILIFDDSVSAVDTDTEAKILANLRRVRQGKTTIMIAHRISTVENLDKIIVMDEGKVIGVGNHEYLMATNPIYQEMHHLQELEKAVDGGDFNE